MKKVVVKGPAFSRSGYGEQTRFALRALRQKESLLDLYLINIPWGQTGFIVETSDERDWMETLMKKTMLHVQQGGVFDASLQVTIPIEWETMAPINIGYTAGIETTKVSPQWLGDGNKMDKIIVVSNHSKEVYETSVCVAQNHETGEQIPNYRCETPIAAVGYPVRNFQPEPVEGLQLDYDSNFLVISQWGIRKNIENTIKWFVEEFQNDEVGLVLKTNVAADCLIDRDHTNIRLRQLLAPYADRKCKIYLLHGSLTEGQLTSLYRHKKITALINIAHGEGFGLPLFEAAYNGMPLVTVAWGGQNDFIYARNKNGKLRAHVAKVDYTMQPVQPEAVWEKVIEQDAMWAYADEKSYKKQLREVYKSPGRFVAQAKKLKKQILKNFSEQAVYNEFIEAFWPSAWGTIESASETFDVESWLGSLDLETHE